MHAGVLHVLGKAPIRPSSIGTINHKRAYLQQATLGAEKTPTIDAVEMTLTVVLLQATGVLEEPVTTVAIVVCVEAVCDQLVVVFKVGVTFATVVMSGTLDIVLLETTLRIKVPITIITVVVVGRV